MKKNILVFPSASNLAIEIYYSLSKDKNINLIGCSSVNNEITKIFTENVFIKEYMHDKNFFHSLNKIIKKHKIDLIYPLSDDVNLFFIKNQANIKCDVLCTSKLKTAKLLSSKSKTYKHLEKHIAVPNLIGVPKEFPVFIKPDKGNSSKDCYLVKNKQDLSFYLNKIKEPIVMEYLSGEEYTVDCFTDFNKKLIFSQPRIRINKSLGAASFTKQVYNKTLIDMAFKINSILDFNGAWFFQAKTSKDKIIKLLEISPRIGASSGINRFNDVNLPLLNIYNHFKNKIEVISNNFNMTGFRYLNYRFDFSFKEFKHAYIDFDDTIYVNGKINSTIMKLIFDLKNEGLKVFLISKHKGDLNKKLQSFGIKDLFDKIIHLNKDDSKASYIKGKSFLIDDSFSERKEVKNKGFYAFPVDFFYSEI